MKQFFKQLQMNIRMKMHTFSKGFTLVETLVAISIFTMSILVLMTVLSNGIADTGFAKKKMVASYLAQAGIEYVRNMRDTEMLYSATPDAGWAAFQTITQQASASCQAANGCTFNTDNLFSTAPPMPITKIPVTACGSSCPQYQYNAATGDYGYSIGGVASGYINRIRVVPINANEMKIFSTIFWTQPSGTFSINFSESIYNWIE